MRRYIALAILAVIELSGCSGTRGGATGVLSAPLPSSQSHRVAHVQSSSLSGIHVSGNQLVDGSNTVVHLQGVNRSGTEYACVQG